MIRILKFETSLLRRMSHPYTIDECPEEYRVLYYYYLNDPATNSEKTMSPAEFSAYRERLKRERQQRTS